MAKDQDGVAISPSMLRESVNEPSDGVISIDSSEKTLNQAKVEVERHYIQQALTRAAGNKTAAARLLGVSYATFKQKLRLYNLRVVCHVS